LAPLARAPREHRRAASEARILSGAPSGVRLRDASRGTRWRDVSGGSGLEHYPLPVRRWRMKTIGMLSALCLCTMQLLGPLPAAAQGNPLQLRLGSHLLGSTVKNPQGKELGSITDLVISPEDNRVVYAVLSFGGVFGLGEKAVAMPLSALKPAAEAKTFVLEMDPERLRTAPEYNQDNWPQMTDPQWITSVYTFYGLKPYWQP